MYIHTYIHAYIRHELFSPRHDGPQRAAGAREARGRNPPFIIFDTLPNPHRVELGTEFGWSRHRSRQ